MAFETSIAADTDETIPDFDPIRDTAYFLSQRDSLLRDYAGRMVAICNEEVIADAETYFALYWKLCDRYGEPVSALIRKVCPASFEDMGNEPAYLVL